MTAAVPRLVDSHCHLPLLERPLEAALRDAALAGVGHLLCVSVDMTSFPAVRQVAVDHPQVFASVGVHPNSELGPLEPDIDQLVALADDPRIVAIGETGLDYFRQSGELAWQHERFRCHIEAAVEARKPLIIHTREAAADTVRLLRETRADRIGGVMHCFVEDWETAQAAMDLGFYISFSGIVTFRNAADLQAVAKRVPLDRLLVETDAPWLAPVPKRGKTNEPAYVRHTAEFLANLREESLETVITATTQNFFRLFSAATPVGD